MIATVQCLAISFSIIILNATAPKFLDISNCILSVSYIILQVVKVLHWDQLVTGVETQKKVVHCCSNILAQVVNDPVYKVYLACLVSSYIFRELLLLICKLCVKKYTFLIFNNVITENNIL